MSKVKKVLYIINTLSVGGAENHLLQVVKELNKSNFSVTVCYFEEYARSAKSLVNSFVGIEGVKLNKIGVFPYTRIPNFIKLLSFLRNNKFDIIHTLLFKADLFGFFANRFTHKSKIICTINDHELFAHHRSRIIFFLFEKLMNKVYSCFDTLIVISKAIQQTVAIKFPSVPENKIKLIYYGIDQPKRHFAYDSYLKSKYGLSNDTKLIGCVGRIDYNKRQDLLIEAFLNANLKDCYLVLVGHDDYGLCNKLLSKISDCSLRDRIIYHGFDSNIADILKSLDLLVCCSENEGLGLIVIESMFMETLVLAANSGAYLELIEDSYNGLLFESGSATDLACKIKLALELPYSSKLVENGKNIAESNFTANSMIKNITKVYDAIAD